MLHLGLSTAFNTHIKNFVSNITLVSQSYRFKRLKKTQLNLICDKLYTFDKKE